MRRSTQDSGGIIRAGPLHATALSAIHARAFPEDEYWDAHIIAGQLSQPGIFGLIDPVGGMLLARLAADEAEILTLAVVPERRQQGLGGRPPPRRRAALPGSLDAQPRGAGPLPAIGLPAGRPPPRVLR